MPLAGHSQLLVFWLFQQSELWLRHSSAVMAIVSPVVTQADGGWWQTSSDWWQKYQKPYCIVYNTRGYFLFLCTVGFYFESGSIFPMQSAPWMSNHARCVFEVSAAVCSIWNLKKKIRLQNHTLRLRFLNDGLWVGDGGERVPFSFCRNHQRQSQIETLIQIVLPLSSLKRYC